MTNFVGRAERQKGKWIITAQPHVMIKLKQIFSGIKKDAIGTVELSDTPANCAELLWFCQRYPLDVVQRSYMAMQAALQHEREATMAKVLAPDYVPPANTAMALPPRHYQQVAADYVYHSGGLLLVDEMGLGKTCVGITVMTKPGTLPAVVVAESQICRQWCREIIKFAPGLLPHLVREGKPYDVTLSHYDRSKRQWIHTREPDVLVMNYHKLSGWAEWLVKERRATTLIFDEVQALRHHETARHSAARTVRAAARWCLATSGTPIYNYGGEIWSVLDVVSPGSLGARDEFGREWCTSVGMDGSKLLVNDPDALGTYLRSSGVMLRRSAKDVGKELPAMQTVIHQIDADTDVLADISANAIALAKTILATTGSGISKMQAHGEFDAKLRQATGIAKAPHVAQFVRMIVEQGHKVLLMGWHRAVYELWLRLLSDERQGDLKPVFITGSETERQKDESFKKFTEGDSQVLILSHRSASGLDGMQKVCSRIVWGELPWCPGEMEQANYRLQRDGQGEIVTSYVLVADDGSDPVMMDILGVKDGQSNGIRDPGSAVAKPLANQVDPAHIRKLAEAYLRKHAERQTTT